MSKENPQQYYDKGQPITLSSYNQLSDYDSETWVWEGRKFEYYLSSDGVTKLYPEQLATFTGDRSYISAIWSMDDSADPVKVYLIGDTGNVSVTVTEQNWQYPLGSSSNQYLCSYVVVNESTKTNTLSSIVIKRQPDDDQQSSTGQRTFVKLQISKGDTTTIEHVYWANTEQTVLTGPYYSGCNYVPAQVFYNWDHKTSRNCREYGLSVYFSEKGILEYRPNKDTVNPLLRTT